MWYGVTIDDVYPSRKLKIETFIVDESRARASTKKAARYAW